MPEAITRRAFVSQLADGVDLNDSQLRTKLGSAGVGLDRLDRLDGDGDGVLLGCELRRAFNLIDTLDRNGTRHSFDNAGRAGQLYEALAAGRRQSPSPNYDIGIAALSRARHRGADYAFDAAPTSPHPELSRNEQPGVTQLSWLKQQNKCNQFVGDVLTEAGFAMPTYRMRDGSKHYMNAEALPAQQRYFDRVTSTDDIRLGDVIVVDYPGRGVNTAHTEIVTGRDAASGLILATGAHSTGAYERDWSDLLAGASYDARQQAWENPSGSRIYLLRPTRRHR